MKYLKDVPRRYWHIYKVFRFRNGFRTVNNFKNALGKQQSEGKNNLNRAKIPRRRLK